MKNSLEKEQEYMRLLAKNISRQIPGLGFALFVFEFDKPGMSNYISNAQREPMIQALEETLQRFKNNEVVDTSGISSN